MTFSTVLLILAMTSAMAAEPSGLDEYLQSQRSFEAAFQNHSSSPSFVRITVVDTRSGAARITCTDANFVVGAIMREFSVGSGEAIKIALANREHVFRFASQAAIDNIPVHFSEGDLAAVRARLAPLSVTQLQAAFSSLDKSKRLALGNGAGIATACALIERGLSPFRSDRSGLLLVEP